VFLDATRVLWVRVEDHSVGDIGMLSASLHVAGPTGDVVIDSKPTNSMWSAIAVLPNGTIALPGDHLFLDAAGTARIPNALSIVNILGITADGASIISFSTDGTLRRVDLDGEPHDLAHGGQFIGPSAAYTAASSSSSVQPRALKN
jgi:hypothetical protein